MIWVTFYLENDSKKNTKFSYPFFIGTKIKISRGAAKIIYLQVHAHEKINIPQTN